MVDPSVEPVAHHNPVPVPLHWQTDVKAGLDQDVSLNVIKPVPLDEPVTWCHRMLVCAKKNGKPHRTVDFQALNLHATRETHHTQRAHSIKHVPYPVTRRRPYLTAGMVTIVFLYHPMVEVPLQNCTLRLHSIRRWLLKTV